MRSAPIPMPPGGIRTNEDEARWLEQTIILQINDMLASAGVKGRVAPNGLYDLLLLSLKAAGRRAIADRKQA